MLLIMHTYFNFSFIYPVTQSRDDPERKGGLRYDLLADLIVNGIWYNKVGNTRHSHEERYNFKIEEILCGDKNIYPQLEAMQELDNIKDACLHHINHMAIGQRTDYRIPYIPLKIAI